MTRTSTSAWKVRSFGLAEFVPPSKVHKIKTFDPMQPTILIVDDEKHTRDGLRRLPEDDYDTYVAANISERDGMYRARSGLMCSSPICG